MTSAVTAQHNGFDYQARLFWLKAVDLLDPNKGVARVSFELGPKGFDDISVEYLSAKARTDQHGARILREHRQCKWHTTDGTFGYEDLSKPEFINAKAVSFLQRALQAQRDHAPNGDGCKFRLITNWRIRQGDPLSQLIRKDGDGLDLKRLAEGAMRGITFDVRKCWTDHLGINDDELLKLARTLVISQTTESLMDLRERLDERLAWAGLQRLNQTSSACLYDDLIRKLHGQGRNSFDPDQFRAVLIDEGLLSVGAKIDRPLAVGVRSFMHPFDDMESRCDRLLDLVPKFDGRYIRDRADWNQNLLPEIKDFVTQTVRKADHLRFCIDAHVSLAFAVGATLTTKSGRRIEIEQRTSHRDIWSRDGGAPGADATFDIEVIPEGGGDIGVAVSLTHEIGDAMRRHVVETLPAVGRILHVRPQGGPSQQAIASGRQAFDLAEATCGKIRHLAADVRPGRCHLFIAAPNAFTFFLGQFQVLVGPCSLYEFDFEGSNAYCLGISIPGPKFWSLEQNVPSKE